MKKYKNKLRYRSWHRGTKEADIFLGRFYDKYVFKMTKEDLILYETFLNLLNDNDLLYMIRGEISWHPGFPEKIISFIEEFIKSENFR